MSWTIYTCSDTQAYNGRDFGSDHRDNKTDYISVGVMRTWYVIMGDFGSSAVDALILFWLLSPQMNLLCARDLVADVFNEQPSGARFFSLPQTKRAECLQKEDITCFVCVVFRHYSGVI